METAELTGKSSTSAFVLSGVSKTFGNGTEALSGLDLTVAAGERVSLLGPSGCGKSTALRIVAGLDAATSGSVNLAKSDEHALSFVFQEATLLPWATVARNIAMPLSLAGAAKDEIAERVEDILARVDLLEFEDAYPRELSGGMKMRVSIARALVTRPRLLLMDEPFAALDEITRFRLNDMLLEQQAREKFTLLFVTHSVFESVYLSERVVVLSPRPGRVAAELEIKSSVPHAAKFRTSKSYIAICRQVSTALDRAMTTPAR